MDAVADDDLKCCCGRSEKGMLPGAAGAQLADGDFEAVLELDDDFLVVFVERILYVHESSVDAIDVGLEGGQDGFEILDLDDVLDPLFG
jgi:hypothetical protein